MVYRGVGAGGARGASAPPLFSLGVHCTPTFPGEKLIYLQEFSCLVSKSPQNHSQSTKFCKIFWGGMPPDPPSRARSYGTCTDASPPGFFAPPLFTTFLPLWCIMSPTSHPSITTMIAWRILWGANLNNNKNTHRM